MKRRTAASTGRWLHLAPSSPWSWPAVPGCWRGSPGCCAGGPRGSSRVRWPRQPHRALSPVPSEHPQARERGRGGEGREGREGEGRGGEGREGEGRGGEGRGGEGRGGENDKENR